VSTDACAVCDAIRRHGHRAFTGTEPCARCGQPAKLHEVRHPHTADGTQVAFFRARPCWAGFAPPPAPVVSTAPAQVQCPADHAAYKTCPLCRGTGYVEELTA
jgi:hypothetical protein